MRKSDSGCSACLMPASCLQDCDPSIPLQHHLRALRDELEDARKKIKMDSETLSAPSNELDSTKEQVDNLPTSAALCILVYVQDI